MKLGEIFRSSLVFAAIAIIVNIVIFAATYLIAGDASKVASGLVLILLLALIALTYVSNLAIYFLAGFFTGKKEGATAMDGGIAACFAFFIALTLTTLIKFIVEIALFSSLMGSSDSADTGQSGMVLIGMLGAMSLVFAVINYAFTLFAGLFINFVAGAIGGYLTSKKFS